MLDLFWYIINEGVKRLREFGIIKWIYFIILENLWVDNVLGEGSGVIYFVKDSVFLIVIFLIIIIGVWNIRLCGRIFV